MLLFSTVVNVTEALTKEAFVKLIIDWNQNSPHSELVIPGLSFTGELSGKWGDEKVSLTILEYRNEDIVASRFEQKDDSGVIWCTDFVCNYLEQKLSVILERSYTEEAQTRNYGFSTPLFLKLLSEQGYLSDDGDLETGHRAIVFDKEAAPAVADIVLGNSKHQLSVILISPDETGTVPLDADTLAYHLKGVAHILIPANAEAYASLQTLTEGKCPYDGAAGHYFPNGHSSVFLNNDSQFGDIKHSVLKYRNSQLIPSLYTWPGVDIALTRDKLAARDKKIAGFSDTQELLDYATQDNDELAEQVRKLTAQVESLTYEVQAIRARLGGEMREPVLYMGEKEKDFFPDEIKAIVLETLEQAATQQLDGSRRQDVLKDIVASNTCEMRHKDLEQKLKSFLLDSKTFGDQAESILAEIGFVLVGDKNHPKYAFHGDQRYMTTLAKTPSDGRSGKNTASDIIKQIF